MLNVSNDIIWKTAQQNRKFSGAGLSSVANSWKACLNIVKSHFKYTKRTCYLKEFSGKEFFSKANITLWRNHSVSLGFCGLNLPEAI